MRFGDWINRKRHNRGFGIQSPSAFFFITQVLKERLPYYAYTRLDQAVADNKGMSPSHARELFRITNHLQPQNCISVNSIAAACAMSAARPSVKKCAFIANESIAPTAKSMLHELQCTTAKSIDKLPALLNDEIKEIGMLYIGYSDNYDALFNTILPHINKNSVIIVEGIHRNSTVKQWWQNIVLDKRTVITYDMYSYGLVFFDTARYKQHYTLKR